MNSLRTLPIDEFKSKLKPAFDDIVKQLPADKQSSINFDEIIVESYNRLQKLNVDIEISDITFETHPDVQDTACVTAVIQVIFDGLGILFQCAGLSKGVSNSIIAKIIKDITPGEMTAIEATIKAFNDTGSTLKKAKFILTLCNEVFTAVGAKAFWKAMQESMSWYDWVKFGVAAMAQIVVWFGSDGAAFIAEVILLTVAIATITQDIAAAQKACASTQ